MSIQYPLKAIEVIAGETDDDGRPMLHAVVRLLRTNGEYIEQVNPTTGRCNGKPQLFLVLHHGVLEPIRDA